MYVKVYHFWIRSNLWYKNVKFLSFEKPKYWGKQEWSPVLYSVGTSESLISPSQHVMITNAMGPVPTRPNQHSAHAPAVNKFCTIPNFRMSHRRISIEAFKCQFFSKAISFNFVFSTSLANQLFHWYSLQILKTQDIKGRLKSASKCTTNEIFLFSFKYCAKKRHHDFVFCRHGKNL